VHIFQNADVLGSMNIKCLLPQEATLPNLNIIMKNVCIVNIDLQDESGNNGSNIIVSLIDFSLIFKTFNA